MGKKARKTRWRTLSINGPQSDSEDTSVDMVRSQATPGSKPYQNGTARYSTSSHSTPTKYYKLDKSVRTSTPPSNDSKITFNEDEYTRITTPRQDVLFKKGYLNKPKSYNTTNGTTHTSSRSSTNPHHHSHHGPHQSLASLQTSNTGTSTGNSTANGTPDHQSADGTEGTDPEYEQPPFVYPNSYMENGGIYFINTAVPSFEAYPPMVVYNTAPVCYPTPYRVKRYSTDSMAESTSPHNEHQDAPDTAASSDYNAPVFNFVYPGYYYGNGVYHTQDAMGEDERPVDPRRPKKKRRLRRVSRSRACNEGATDSCGEEYSSEDELASPSECSTDHSDGTKQQDKPKPSPIVNGHVHNNTSTPPNTSSPVHVLTQTEASIVPNPSESPRNAEPASVDQSRDVAQSTDQSASTDVTRDDQSNATDVSSAPSESATGTHNLEDCDRSNNNDSKTINEAQIDNKLSENTNVNAVENIGDDSAVNGVTESDNTGKTELNATVNTQDNSESKMKYRVEAEEFVPRAYRQQSFENHLPVTNFIPLPIINDIYPPNFANAPFIPSVPINFIPGVPHYDKFIPGFMPPNQYYVNQTDNYYVKTTPNKNEKEDKAEKSSKSIDIAKIVSKLEEAAIEQNKQDVDDSNEAKIKSKQSPRQKTFKKTENDRKKVPEKPIASLKPLENKPDPPYSPKKLPKQSTPPKSTSVEPQPIKEIPNRTQVTPKETRVPQTKYSETLKKHLTKPVTTIKYPKLDHESKKSESSSNPSTPITPNPTRKPEPKSTDQWISVSSRKKRKNKNIIEDPFNDLPENEPLQFGEEEIIEIPPEPIKEIKIEPTIVELPTQVHEVIKPVVEKKPKKDKPKPQNKKRIMINDSALIQDKKIVKPDKVNGEIKSAEKKTKNNSIETEENQKSVVKTEPKINPKKLKTLETQPKIKEPEITKVTIADTTSTEITETEPLDKTVNTPNLTEVEPEEPLNVQNDSTETVSSSKRNKLDVSTKVPSGSAKTPVTPEPAPVKQLKNLSESAEDSTSDSPPKPQKSPEIKSKKKKKKPKSVKVNGMNSSVEDGFDFLNETSSDDVSSKTNVEISLELDKMIQRGLYANLEEKIKSFNPSDSFIKQKEEFKSVEPPNGFGLFKGLERLTNFDYNSVLFNSTMNKTLQKAMINKLADEKKNSESSDPARCDFLDKSDRSVESVESVATCHNQTEKTEPKPYLITKAVKEWMDRTRENTPDVELLKSVDEIRNEFFLTDSEEEESTSDQKNEDGNPQRATSANEPLTESACSRVALSRETSPDLLDCWDDSAIDLTARTGNKTTHEVEKNVDVGEDVLEIYESVYGKNEAFLKIQEEIKANAGRRYPDNSLPYRAICCSLM